MLSSAAAPPSSSPRALPIESWPNAENTAHTATSVTDRVLVAADIDQAPALFPIGLNDRVVVAEDQVEAVGIVRDAPDTARRVDPAQHLGEILLADHPGLPRLRLAALGKLLPDAVLA